MKIKCDCTKRVLCEDGKVESPNGNSYFYTDPCIRNVIQALFSAGFEITASCCGHNEGDPSICLSTSHTQKDFNRIMQIIDSFDLDQMWEVRIWESLSMFRVGDATGIVRQLPEDFKFEPGFNKDGSIKEISIVNIPEETSLTDDQTLPSPPPAAIAKEDRTQCEAVDLLKEELTRLNNLYEINKLDINVTASLNRSNREGTSDGPNRETRKRS